MKREKISKTAASGIVALIFLIVGFQAAIFFTKIIRIETMDDSDKPSAVAFIDSIDYAREEKINPSVNKNSKKERLKTGRTPLGGYETKQETPRRSYESFPFDPNESSIGDFVKLGLTEKQAQSIVNYREKGGKFRKKSDFAKMYVVSDTLYERLEPFIQIPKIELNGADTTTLKLLPGIGSYYAKKIASYRELLGGFYEIEQLLEIEGISIEKFDGLKEYACVDTSKIKQMDIWDKSEDSLASHPYIGVHAAKGIIRYKACTDTLLWSVEQLESNGIISETNARKLKRYF